MIQAIPVIQAILVIHRQAHLVPPLQAHHHLAHRRLVQAALRKP